MTADRAGLPPFDANDYRKRVLAAVEKRGGPDTSDPFELYDIPIESAAHLSDAAVAERIAEVWGAWQRQRDHPKYRVLVGLLVETHEMRSAELLDAGRRTLAAARVRAQREQRDSARYELLDAAISRLVQRHGGIPKDKVAGLEEVGALAGLTPAEVAARTRRHRFVESSAAPKPPPEPGIGVERRRQVRALLDEFGRLTDSPAPPTLLALLGLEPSAAQREVRARAAAWRSRARELPPERLRAVVDELLVHVEELIEAGRPAIEAYLDAVAVDVTEHLRPRVRAAVLVEDRLVADDHVHLVEEAVAHGLDEARARAVLERLAAELGTTIESASHPAPPPPARPSAPQRPRWEEPLKAARAALRAGRPVEAKRKVAEAQRLAGADGATPVRAVAGEIDAVLAEAELRRRAAETAYAARRWTEACEHLEHLSRTAADTADDIERLLAEARRHVERADSAVAAALAGAESERARLLLAVLDTCPGHPGAMAALEQLPLVAPPWVNAARDARGDVVVLWAPSTSPEVVYRVSRQRPDGSWQVLGRVSSTSMEDGGAPPGVEAPVYSVVAMQAGRSSAETRSDTAPEPTTPVVASAAPPARGSVGAPPAPSEVLATRISGGSVRVSWTSSAVGDVEYRVRCLVDPAAERWRVVGRTRDTAIEDGGAPAGEVPVYAVSAAVAGVRSAECRSDGHTGV
ncbi:Ig-like domain repeat protein [Actinomycetes bacterium KLBMP 9759]